jgi:hypothetical protein
VPPTYRAEPPLVCHLLHLAGATPPSFHHRDTLFKLSVTARAPPSPSFLLPVKTPPKQLPDPPPPPCFLSKLTVKDHRFHQFPDGFQAVTASSPFPVSPTPEQFTAELACPSRSPCLPGAAGLDADHRRHRSAAAVAEHRRLHPLTITRAPCEFPAPLLCPTVSAPCDDALPINLVA